MMRFFPDVVSNTLFSIEQPQVKVKCLQGQSGPAANHRKESKMKSTLASTLAVLTFAVAGLAQAAPVGQFSLASEGESLSQQYPGNYEQSNISGKSREQVAREVRGEQSQHQSGKFASDSEGATLAQLFPASEASSDKASTLTRAEVKRDYFQARANGELHNSDNGLTDREMFPQMYAAKAGVRIQ